MDLLVAMKEVRNCWFLVVFWKWNWQDLLVTGFVRNCGCLRRRTSATERSYLTSEVRGRSWEDPMPERQRPRGVTPGPRSGAAAERSYFASEIRSGGWECQAATAQEQPRGVTPRPRSGAGARRWYPLPQARGGDREELPHVQGAVAARAQEGLEELLDVQGQEGWRWGDTRRSR